MSTIPHVEFLITAAVVFMKAKIKVKTLIAVHVMDHGWSELNL